MAKNKNKVKNLTGKRFGRLTVIGVDDRGTKKTYWNCLCDCGNIKSVRSDSLQNGAIKSCGCLKKEQDKKNLINDEMRKVERFGGKFGHIRIHSIWSSMKGRCYNTNDARYSDYGGRGITVCDEWRNDFFAFYSWAMENGYSDDMTIDRIDNDRGYSPENCRWVDNRTQARNRRTNINITIGNATKTLTEWCEIFELPYSQIHARYERNGFISLDDLFKS